MDLPRGSLEGGYDPGFFRLIAEVEDRHFWFRARNRVISAAIARLTDALPDGYRVLEVGCGTGNVLRHLKRVCDRGQVLGMELFPKAAEMARERTGCEVICGDVRKPPATGAFDVVCMFDVIEHIPEDVAVLAGARSILREGGRLVLTVPAHSSLWSYFDVASRHVRRYDGPVLTARMREAGYEVEYLTSFMAALYPFLAIGRWFNSAGRCGVGDSARRAEADLTVVPVLNSILYALLWPDALAVSGKMRLPIGTSLLAVGTR